MNRRGFLKGMLALGATPAIVRSASLMKLIVPEQEIIVPNFGLALVKKKGVVFFTMQLIVRFFGPGFWEQTYREFP